MNVTEQTAAKRRRKGSSLDIRSKSRRGFSRASRAVTRVTVDEGGKVTLGAEMGRHKASSRASRAASGVAVYEGGGMTSDPKYRRARSSSRVSQAAATAAVFEGGGISSDSETEAPVPRGTGHSSWQGVTEMDSGNTPKRVRLDKETETLDTFEFLHQKVMHQEEEIAQLRAHEVAVPSISQETLLRMYS